MKKELANNFRRTPKFQTKWKRKAKFALARVDIACRRGPTRPNKQPSRHGISHTNNLSFFRIVPNSKEIHLTMHFQVDPFWRGPAAVAACAPPHELRSPLPQDCVHPEPHAPLPAVAAPGHAHTAGGERPALLSSLDPNQATAATSPHFVWMAGG